MPGTRHYSERPNLPELLARAGIVRAMRPYRRARQYAIGLIVPQWSFRDIYSKAAYDLLGLEEDRRSQGMVRVFNGATGDTEVEAVTDVVRHRRIKADDVARHLPLALTVPPEVIRATAVHEAGHAIVGIAAGMELSRIEISHRLFPGHADRTMGRTVFRQNIWARRTRAHHLDTISMTLAGMAAEQMILGEFDDGSSGGSGSDLHEATRLVLAMETRMGMGAHLVSMGELDVAARALCSGAEREVFARIDDVLQEQFARAKAILTHHRSALDRLVDILSERFVASGLDVFRAMNTGVGDSPEHPACSVVST